MGQELMLWVRLITGMITGGGEGDAEGRVMMNDDHSFLTPLLVPLW